MKNYLTILFAIFLSLVASVASAYDFEVDGIYYTQISVPNTNDRFVSISGASKSKHLGDFVTPVSVKHWNVTYYIAGIGSGAFDNRYDLSSLTVLYGVNSIEQYAFRNCIGLTSITIPGSVQTISDMAFSGCTGLESIVVDDSGAWTYYDSRQNCNAIIESSSDKLIVGCMNTTIPDGVKSIGAGAFAGCICLTSIIIPNSVKEIQDLAFSGCSGLTSLTVPSSVTKIRFNAFTGCFFYTNSFINNSNLSNSNHWGATLYDEETSDGLIISGNKILKCRPWATSVTIPSSVTTIAKNAFLNCWQLNSVIIPNNVTTIGEKAFYNTRLKSVTIGTGVLSIEADAFGFDSSTTGSKPIKVIWLTNTPPSDYSNAEGSINYVANDLYTSLHNKIVYPFLSSIFDVEGIKYVPVSPSERTCDAIDCLYDSSAENIHIGITTSYKGIDLQVKNVQPYICYQNSDIKEVLLDYLGDVPEYAFYGCQNISSVNIFNHGNIEESAFSHIESSYVANINNMGSISAFAFKESIGLTSLSINDKVTDLGEQSFYGCTGLSSVAISNQGSIGKFAFADSKISEKLTVNNIGNIEISAFSGISGSFTANVNNAGSIAESAFKESTGLTALEIGNDVTDLGDNSFYGCTGLTTVSISNKGNIGKEAFSSSQIIESLILNNKGNIETSAFANIVGSFVANINNTGIIASLAFKETSGLTALKIGDNVNDISNNAFQSCLNLQSAILYNKGTLGSSAFASCNSLHIVTLGNEVTSVGNSSFQECFSLKTIALGNNISIIGQYAFDGCSSLESINIPNAVKSIGAYAFHNCSQMISAKIGTGITAIPTHSFSGCSNMTEVQIGPNVRNIENSAFRGCSSLPAITIPEAVNSIGDYTFEGCNALKNVIMTEKASELTLGSNGQKPMFSDCPLDSVFIGRNISYPTESNQGYSPFYRNTSLKSIHISDVETEVSPNEFYGCTNLKNVRLGDGITDIGNWAFSGCGSIDFFSFGSNLENIGKEAFSDCTAMTKLISHSVIPPACGEQALDDINKWNCELEVPYGSLSAYKSEAQWKEFFFIKEADYCNVTAMSYTREYGDANPSFGFTVEGDAIDGQPEIICEATATSPVGEYPIIIKKGSIKNFNGILVNGVLTITKVPLTVSVGNYTKKQGEENPKFALSYSGFKNNETEEVLSKQPSVNCGATVASAPGEYDIIVSGAEAENYEIQYVDGKLIVIESESNNIIFDDNNVKAVCVANWDTNNDGELSIKEAAAVKSIGDCFKNNKGISSFNEFCYFTSVKRIDESAFANCSSLTTIIIPCSVTRICDKAFSGCTSLRTVIIEEIGNILSE